MRQRGPLRRLLAELGGKNRRQEDTDPAQCLGGEEVGQEVGESESGELWCPGSPQRGKAQAQGPQAEQGQAGGQGWAQPLH